MYLRSTTPPAALLGGLSLVPARGPRALSQRKSYQVPSRTPTVGFGSLRGSTRRRVRSSGHGQGSRPGAPHAASAATEATSEATTTPTPYGDQRSVGRCRPIWARSGPETQREWKNGPGLPPGKFGTCSSSSLGPRQVQHCPLTDLWSSKRKRWGVCVRR